MTTPAVTPSTDALSRIVPQPGDEITDKLPAPPSRQPTPAVPIPKAPPVHTSPAVVLPSQDPDTEELSHPSLPSLPVLAAQPPAPSPVVPVADASLPPPPAAEATERDARVVRAASWSHKLAAAVLDASVAGMLTVGYAVVELLELPEAETSAGPPLQGLDWVLEEVSRYSTFLLGVLLAAALSGMLYEALAVSILGRTLGQKMMGVRLLRLDGRPVGVLRGLLRGLLAALGLLFLGAGWLWAPFDRRRMALHDKVLGLVLLEDPGEGKDTASSDPGEMAGSAAMSN